MRAMKKTMRVMKMMAAVTLNTVEVPPKRHVAVVLSHDRGPLPLLPMIIIGRRMMKKKISPLLLIICYRILILLVTPFSRSAASLSKKTKQRSNASRKTLHAMDTGRTMI